MVRTRVPCLAQATPPCGRAEGPMERNAQPILNLGCAALTLEGAWRWWKQVVWGPLPRRSGGPATGLLVAKMAR